MLCFPLWPFFFSYFFLSLFNRSKQSNTGYCALFNLEEAQDLCYLISSGDTVKNMLICKGHGYAIFHCSFAFHFLNLLLWILLLTDIYLRYPIRRDWPARLYLRHRILFFFLSVISIHLAWSSNCRYLHIQVKVQHQTWNHLHVKYFPFFLILESSPSVCEAGLWRILENSSMKLLQHSLVTFVFVFRIIKNTSL